MPVDRLSVDKALLTRLFHVKRGGFAFPTFACVKVQGRMDVVHEALGTIFAVETVCKRRIHGKMANLANKKCAAVAGLNTLVA